MNVSLSHDYSTKVKESQSPTGAPGPLVAPHVGSVLGINLPVLGATDIQTAVPLDCDLTQETGNTLSNSTVYLGFLSYGRKFVGPNHVLPVVGGAGL